MRIDKYNKNGFKILKYAIFSCLSVLAFGLISACVDNAVEKRNVVHSEKVEELKTEEKALTRIDRYTETFSSNYVEAFILKYKGKEYLIVSSHTGAADGGSGIAIHEITEENKPLKEQN